MTAAQRFLALVIPSLVFVVVAAAGGVEREGSAPERSITVSLTRQGARFAALGDVAQTRLEVFGPGGVPLHTSGFQPGNVREWRPAGGAQSLHDGEYLCVVTARGVGGRMSVRQGHLIVTGGALSLQLVQADAFGTGSAAVVAKAEESLLAAPAGPDGAMTITSHDGTDGQITATSGDLTLRTGDFFAGEDQERVRVTVGGRVGIGTVKPEATLDVDGTIRARDGVQFADGTTLSSSEGKLTVKNAEGDTLGPASAAGTGTQDRLVKWAETGGAGTLTDSIVTESSGKIGIGVPAPAQTLHVFGKALFQNTGTASLFILDRTDGKIAALGAAGASSTLAYDDSGIFKIESNSRASIAQGAFGELNGATTRLAVDSSGNVGIGTATPSYRLQVDSGNLLVRGANNFGATSQTAHVYLGDQYNYIRAIYDRGVAIGAYGAADGITLRSGTGRVGIGTTVPAARLHVRASGVSGADNTATFFAPDIGPNASHVHYGLTGDWFIRSALDTGKVILQDTSGQVGIGTSNPTVGKVHVETAAATSVAVFGKATGSGSAGGQFEGTGQGVVGIGNTYGVYGRGRTGVYGEAFGDGGAGGHFIGGVLVKGGLTADGGNFADAVFASAFHTHSDRDAKANFAAVDPRFVLRRLATVPIQTWNFKGERGAFRHMGPMAQDFYAAFELGADDKHIATVDADGVLMASIQGLYEMVQEKEKEIEDLRARLARLERNAAVRPAR